MGLARVAQQFWGLRYIDDAVARRIDANADGDYGDTESQSNPDGTWFCVTDVQFSVVALLDDIAVLAERVRYDAYGRARHRWPTDLDGDGDADGSDYSAQLAAASTTIHGTNYNPDADHDRDGDVDNNDYFTFLGGAGRAALAYGLISDPVGGGPDNPIGYDGYVFAPEAGPVVGSGGGQAQAAGAYVVRFRWYVPETGRWLQRDPQGQTYNAPRSPALMIAQASISNDIAADRPERYMSRRDPAYGYGLSSPPNFVDPAGLCAEGVYRAIVRHLSRKGTMFGVTDIMATEMLIEARYYAEEATRMAQVMFLPSSLHNGAGDAWRHCMWSCRMQLAFGVEVAKIIGDCHEYSGSKAGQLPCEEEMDLHNNRIGMNLFPNARPTEEIQSCASGCLVAAALGQLQTEPPCDDFRCPSFPHDPVNIVPK